MPLRSLASLVRSALALALPALLAASCGGSVLVEDPPPECEPGFALCEGECVSLADDIQNCGGCGNTCFEGSCFNGECQPPVACPPNMIDCFGTCVDPSFDQYNCGGCGLVCEGKCNFGACVTGECYCGAMCQVIGLASEVPQSAFAPASGAPEQWVPSCVSGSGGDVVFSFVAPEDGVYSFDTFGSSVDGVLEIMDPGCFSYGCQGAGGAGGAFVQAKLGAGQMVLAVIDAQGQAGDVQLNINYDGFGGCSTCGDVLTTGDIGDGFCPGSEEIYNLVVNCICFEECAMFCEPVCNGGEFTEECEKCIQDPMAGCGLVVEKCLNDV